MNAVAIDSHNSLWKDAYKKIRSSRVAMGCFIVICCYTIICLLALAGIIAEDYNVLHTDNTYLPPSSDYWFGTDNFGRNVLSRAIHGTVTAFSVGVFASAIAVFIGVTLGSIAGYFGGLIDDLVIWLYTTLDSIPYILLLAAFAFVLGQGVMNVYIALGLTSWVAICRLVRGEFLKQKNREYVQAAKALGLGHTRRIFRHILPNVLHIIIIQFALRFVSAIKVEVILSYLGLGVEPGTPSWGMMIDDAKSELVNGIWWNLGAATLFMFGLVLAVNLFTDSLRQALDPKFR